VNGCEAQEGLWRAVPAPGAFPDEKRELVQQARPLGTEDDLPEEVLDAAAEA
jgi:hypothetical protein